MMAQDLRVLVVHNRYRSDQPSGENRVVEAEVRSLADSGVAVETYVRSSDEIADFNVVQQGLLALRPIASPADSLALRRLITTFRPSIVQIHNTYPLISPWIVRTIKAKDVPIAHTVHNYRHVCVRGSYFRDGRACHDCDRTHVPWPAVVHGCYRDSRLQSVPMAASILVHRPTWNLIDRFLPVGDGVADHLRSIGIPDHRITVRPNVVADPGPPAPLGAGVVYVGRLAVEKGVRLLLQAWHEAGLRTRSTLTIAGDGPLRDEVAAAAALDPSIRYLGLVEQSEVARLLAASELATVPSIWPEPDPLTTISALAAGRAVVAVRGGGMDRIIASGCGWSSSPDAVTLGAVLGDALRDRDELQRKGRAAREVYVQQRNPANVVSLADTLRSIVKTAASV